MHLGIVQVNLTLHSVFTVFCPCQYVEPREEAKMQGRYFISKLAWKEKTCIVSYSAVSTHTDMGLLLGFLYPYLRIISVNLRSIT